MKLKAIYCSLALTLLLIALTNQSVRSQNEERLTFVGKIIHVVPGVMGQSGDLAVFRLAKYQVIKVCEGSYNGKEIVVDHIMMSGHELATAKPGDVLSVNVFKSKVIPGQGSYPGIREPSEKVEMFYIGGDAPPVTESVCP